MSTAKSASTPRDRARAAAARSPRTTTAADASRPRRGPRTAVPALPIAEEVIRVRAYFLSLERTDGIADPVRDWLEAERELGPSQRVPRTPARRRRP